MLHSEISGWTECHSHDFPNNGWSKKTTYYIGVFCLTERLFYILNRMWDLGHFLCEKVSGKSKVVSKPTPETIDCMSPVPYTWCPSADNCVINSWACYICSKVPTHARLTVRRLCSLLLLGLWEIITGNQLADRSFKSYAAAADKHPQVFLSLWHQRFVTPRQAAGVLRGIRGSEKQGQFGQEVAPSHRAIAFGPSRRKGICWTCTQLPGDMSTPNVMFLILPCS